ncbi:MAG TPA: xanthine dehydrogenase accessory protein XdhC [Arenicellales bacterium]|nr:xanthine dehydrogenase accessory protein XdhC [Arenicellales bacterium]
MSDWLSGLEVLSARGEPAVLVTVVEARGSTPREPGARMTVGRSELHDTIGGGQLEHAAIESARLLLEDDAEAYVNTLERHTLSPRMGQCCGGVARLMLERIPARPQAWLDALLAARRGQQTVFTATPIGGAGKQAFTCADELAPDAAAGDPRPPADRAVASGKPVFDPRAGWYIEPLAPPDFDVVLFGAGHVGRAVAGILATLPCTLTWVDSRPGQFPGTPGPNVRTEIRRYPESIVADCPPGAFYLLMTHSHQLDFDICARILARGDFAYCGMIGSQSKRRSCEKRLKLKGITESMLDRLTCPIGAPGISGKRPAEIAVAAAAQILQLRESMQAVGGSRARCGSVSGDRRSSGT